MEDKINGSARAADGTFWMQPHRRFPTDGRQQRSVDRLLDLVHGFETVFPYTANPSLEVALRAIHDARERLDEIEYEAVAVARGARWSWRDIGRTLDMTGSAAYKRFARDRAQRETPARKWSWALRALEHGPLGLEEIQEDVFTEGLR
jgi:hypothetical protein